MDADLNSDEFNIGMNDYQSEEKKAFSTPLSAQEMTKMESSGKNLLKDITSGMKEYGKDQFWRKNPFFKKHNGF
jgi:hypothetical protein